MEYFSKKELENTRHYHVFRKGWDPWTVPGLIPDARVNLSLFETLES